MIRRTIGSVILNLILSIPIFAAEEPPKQTILFLGNSLTVGYGLEKSQAFPELIQQKITTRNWPFVVVNAGISGDTSSSGLRRIDWLLKRPIDILILELGANDALRGVPLDITRQNLQKIIDKTTAKYPNVHIVIAGMEAPPNMGNDYAAEFRSIFKDLSQKNQAALIPFLLENVAGHPHLNQPDRIHPTAEGHKIVAENVWLILKPVLETILDRASQLRN